MLGLARKVIIRDVEDPEIRIIVSGQEFNPQTLRSENEKTELAKMEV
jgi:hypothetical protein